MGLKSILRKAKHGVEIITTLGTAHRCPLCGHSFSRFLMAGEDSECVVRHSVVGAGRRSCRCPRCGCYDRDRLVSLFLRDFFADRDDKELKILHIAPELALSKYILSQKNTLYIRGDKFEKGYTYPSGVINIDLTAIPFDDNTFDLLVCNHVMEHIPDDATAMRECFRVLKPGGTAILQVPYSPTLEQTIETPVNTPEERRRLYGQHDHVRLYGRDYPNRLRAAGFTEALFRPAPADIHAYGLNPAETLLVFTKP